MNGEAFLSLLQFSDGLFPAGSYAHSFGLETYAADGTIRDASGVERFLLSYLARFCRADRCHCRARFAESGAVGSRGCEWNSASPSMATSMP